MFLNVKSMFQRDYDRYDGIRRINIYLMRLVYILMLCFLGKDSWSHILAHQGAWEAADGMAWSVWAAFSSLALLGFLHPVKMIPLLLFEVFYKVLWLSIVAYPLWKSNTLVGSAVEGMTDAFLWVILPIVVLPWAYIFKSYILNTSFWVPKR
ncbi:hypothetical protein H8K47_10620 [Undibacterium sp. CY7W]|uniref:Uncharacterized protein n=1 Tax=Undibacterium rugosum TaxID=2762291 RepID=A0A923I105_9BURK|nr:hypothetical protein [Undibacterium rugosum]MBC3935813.1 hypothetical protein [Undibacterium rugosum]